MKLGYRIALMSPLARLAVAGPFTIKWFPNRTCSNPSRNIGCSFIDEWECCDAPPGREVFTSMRGTTSGPFGIVVRTSVTAEGGCGLCTGAVPLNQCTTNVPFNTALVATFTQCQVVGGGLLKDVKEEVTLVPTSKRSECRRSVPIDTATVNGHEYDLTGADREEIMDDVTGMDDDEEFAAKWAHVWRGPAEPDV